VGFTPAPGGGCYSEEKDMSVACCDPKKEPRNVDPNQFQLESRVWSTVSVSVPSLLTPATVPDGTLFAFPVRQPPGAPAAPARYRTEKGMSLLLPSAGDYKVWNDGTRDLEMVAFDSRDASATEIYAKDGYYVPTHLPITIGAGSTPVWGDNINARYRLVVNNGPNNIWITLGIPAAPNTGILLQPNGGAYEMLNQSLYHGRVSCAGTAGDILLSTEGV